MLLQPAVNALYRPFGNTHSQATEKILATSREFIHDVVKKFATCRE
jgi:hypothetical protein